MAKPHQTIVDLNRHPWDTASILDWMLSVWDDEPQWHLLVITSKGDGAALDNRLRVKLSHVRRELKHRKISGIKQFGFESNVIAWTTLDGIELEALCLRRTFQIRHAMGEAIEDLAAQLRN